METVDDLLATLSEVVGNYAVPPGREQISADEPIQKQGVAPAAPDAQHGSPQSRNDKGFLISL
jgi:hypothetical protein